MSGILKLLIAVMLSLTVAACSGRGGARDASLDATSDGDIVGVLFHSNPDTCPLPDGCGPEFSLLDENLSLWTPLEGRLDPEHHHLVIAVEGRTRPIAREHVQFLGNLAAPNQVRVKRYRLLSTIPYHRFLVEQASEFTTRKYGCDLLWDKSFRWQRADDRANLIVRMTNTYSNEEPKPYLELTYDGQTGHFLEETLEPWGTNPCAG
jgi:hypothetical protein